MKSTSGLPIDTVLDRIRAGKEITQDDAIRLAPNAKALGASQEDFLKVLDAADQYLIADGRRTGLPRSALFALERLSIRLASVRFFLPSRFDVSISREVLEAAAELHIQIGKHISENDSRPLSYATRPHNELYLKADTFLQELKKTLGADTTKRLFNY